MKPFLADDPRHGTYAGAMAHQARKQPKCDACKKAAREYAATLRPGGRTAAAQRERAAARSRALWKLQANHPDEFQALYLEEMRQVREAS